MTKEHLHVMGIGGSGAGPFAKLAESRGYKVSGCDRSLGGHSPSHLDGVDILIVSPAIFSLDPGNMELVEARRRGIEVFTWQEFLGKYLMEDARVIGVCGTHGKTTVAAMIAYILERGGCDPTYLLGARIRGGNSFRLGRGSLFVVEADEFNNNFLNYPVSLSVCVALEFDHPEYFSNLGEYLSSFDRFVRNGRQLICNRGDGGVRALLKQLRGWGGKVVGFDTPYRGDLSVFGVHNRVNAQAAYLAARTFGVSAAAVRNLLRTFPGVERRLELKRVVGGAKIYGDYAHHPTQLRVVGMSLRQLYPRERIVVVFQPHMFSRTKALFGEFVSAIREIPVDEVFVTDIFPSREKDLGEVCSRDLVASVRRETVRYLPRERIVSRLKQVSGDVIAFLGAGDINRLIGEL